MHAHARCIWGSLDATLDLGLNGYPTATYCPACITLQPDRQHQDACMKPLIEGVAPGTHSVPLLLSVGWAAMLCGATRFTASCHRLLIWTLIWTLSSSVDRRCWWDGRPCLSPANALFCPSAAPPPCKICSVTFRWVMLAACRAVGSHSYNHFVAEEVSGLQIWRTAYPAQQPSRASLKTCMRSTSRVHQGQHGQRLCRGPLCATVSVILQFKGSRKECAGRHQL